MGYVHMKRLVCFAVLVGLVLSTPAILAQPDEGQDAENKAKLPQIKDPKDLRKLTPDSDVWFDAKNKQVVMGGNVCQRDALLEMFACPVGTKEHESLISVKARALVVHTALLATGAESGKPAHWDPKTKKYFNATGDPIDIQVEWLDKDGKRQRVNAQQWVRNVKTKKAMTSGWVFGGSGFHVDETTKRRHYLAESGSLICVSNFPDATLDLPTESSKSNEELLYTPFTERIPPQGTRVLVYMKPIKKKADEKEK